MYRLLASRARLALCIGCLLAVGSLPARAVDFGPGPMVLSPDGGRLYVYDGDRYTLDWINPATLQLHSDLGYGVFYDLPLKRLAVSPDGSRLYATRPGPPQNTGWVQVIDSATGHGVAAVTVGADPEALATTPDGKRLYVAYTDDWTISVIDTATNQEIATITVGGTPTDLIMTPDGSRLFATLESRDGLAIIDLATNRVTATDAAGDFAWRGAISPDGRYLYILSPINGWTLQVVDTGPDRPVAGVTVGLEPEGVGVSPDGKRIYVANGADNTVSVVDATTNRVTATVMLGGTQIEAVYDSHVAVSPDGKRIYVAIKATGVVSVLDAASLQVIGSWNVGSVSSRLDGSWVFPPEPLGTDSIWQ